MNAPMVFDALRATRGKAAIAENMLGFRTIDKAFSRHIHRTGTQHRSFLFSLLLDEVLHNPSPCCNELAWVCGYNVLVSGSVMLWRGQWAQAFAFKAAKRTVV